MRGFITDYGLHFYIVGEAELEKYSAYDRTIAKIHIERYGFIIVDEYQFPIDNEYDLEAIDKFLRNIH